MGIILEGRLLESVFNLKERILVCGGRDFEDSYKLDKELTFCRKWFHQNAIIIHGGQRGADDLAGWWAKLNGYPCAIVPANWQYYNKAAGAIRNSWMLLLNPDLVIAFPGGIGTRDMINKAINSGIDVYEVR